MVDTLNDVQNSNDKANKLNEYSLGIENYRLFLYNEKYYYFCEYEKDENGYDNMSLIEKNTFYNDIAYLTIDKPQPKDSYLILIYKVNEINDSILKDVIKLEENEYLFKKYVFYYTDDEYSKFKAWYEKQIENKNISYFDLISLPEIKNNMKEDYIQFFLRLLIKMPFMQLKFNQMKFEDFESIFNKKIDRIKVEKESIKNLLDIISRAIDIEDSDTIAQSLLDNAIGGVDND